MADAPTPAEDVYTPEAPDNAPAVEPPVEEDPLAMDMDDLATLIDYVTPDEGPTPAPEGLADLGNLLGVTSDDTDPLSTLLGIDSVPPTIGTVIYDPMSDSNPTFSPTLGQLTSAPSPSYVYVAPTAAGVLPTVVAVPRSPTEAIDVNATLSKDPGAGFDDNVCLLYDVYALVLAVYFPLATFCGVRFEALLAVPGLNIWAVAFAFVVAVEVGLEDDVVAKFVFAAVGTFVACIILYTMGFFSITLMGMFAGVLLGSGLHDYLGQYVSELNDEDVEWSKVIYIGLCPLLFMVLVLFTEWRGQAIMWAFTGAYYGVAMIDWMGYRWDYTSEPRFWPSNYITSRTTLEDCEGEWCIIMLSLWGVLFIMGTWVQFSWGPLPPASIDGDDLREWEPLMWELEQKYNFKGEALEEMAKLQYQIEKKRIFREKLKYESREARKVMKSVARGTFKSSEQRRAEAQEQLKQKRNRWYGSMGKAQKPEAATGGDV